MLFKKLYLLGFMLSFLCLGYGEAQAQSDAKKVLDEGLTEILNVLKSPIYNNPATREQGRAQIASIVKRRFDFLEFSARTVGPRWQQFTSAQQQAFSEAFGDLLINTYVKKIDGYNGEKIAYTGERSGNARTEILTVVTLKDGKKVPVAYRMLPKDQTWKVYDVLIENISLVKNYRSQFQSLLTQANPDELIARVRAKAVEIRDNHAKP